jgi:hypothetical protein
MAKRVPTPRVKTSRQSNASACSSTLPSRRARCSFRR